MPPSTDLLQGTLDMLILKAIAGDAQHGWAIAQRIQQVSRNVLQVGQGSLYPALHRLEYKGWIRAQWGASENNKTTRALSTLLCTASSTKTRTTHKKEQQKTNTKHTTKPTPPPNASNS